ncbi:hypothetical protein [Xanthomonas arboricola]|uniref:hypothetical protein n=1 Tax=Xanthomonas arboricola TaxID=56448 RepID=UPI0015CE3625
MTQALTKRKVRAALGFTRDRELAEFFKTSKQAVSKWTEDEELPAGRQWQARALRPDVFESKRDQGIELNEPAAVRGENEA